MLRNISVRTFIVYFLLCVFLVSDGVIALFSRNSSLFIAVIIVQFIALFLLWAYMTKYLVTPINTVKKSIEEVTSGKLGVSIPEFGNNCAGRLIPGINSLSSNIATLVREIRASSQTAMTLSDQLSSRSAQLSVKTEQQSASLVQTAASMEEMAASTKNNADNTRLASEQANIATLQARKGGELMGQVANNMQSITDCAQQMTEIISLIDGIAFQTNILALNAAVEAARAGAQGRGFAVVASEVRTLAQKSAVAAKDIESLIAQSVSSVKNGAQLVNRSGEVIDSIISSVNKVHTLMEQISVASEEQSRGIGQVGQAVTEMDGVTQQNAALVQQSAAAAASLEEQAQQLSQSISSFSLPATA
ncbi:chemoreceptor protein [Enterobacter hormaechei]|nr:chemoreceptor protein [Enterobacter hormaechei]